MISRRQFILQISLASSALAGSQLSAENTLLSESDPTAIGLGYKSDASKVDSKKFPDYVVGQECANCALYQGKSSDASGACSIFPDKLVTAKGWCSAWNNLA
ncbi:high-potential iron-sulfur protein [Undibacterium sp. RuTC16W]|uniref:high-potential iron-sulfur protein n=1 Tax=Undibacterium sp. RuTC16W TaxID=3413048 RepID=UPI003BF20B49